MFRASFSYQEKRAGDGMKLFKCRWIEELISGDTTGTLSKIVQLM